MKKLNINKLKKYIPLFVLALAILCCNLAIADVGNNNRYSSGGGDFGGGGDGDWGVIIGYLLGLFIENPTVGFIVLVILVVVVLISKRKSKKQATDTTYINKNVNQQADNEFTFDNSTMVAAQIQAIDPASHPKSSSASPVRCS